LREKSSVLIRRATRKDLPQWAWLRQALWPDCTVADSGNDIAKFLSQPEQYETFVAADGKRLVGFLEASLRSYAPKCKTSPVGFIEGWYVEPKYRRSGVGRAFVDSAERWAIGRGCTEMASDALLENALGHKAHKAIGYEEVERQVCFRKALKQRRAGKKSPRKGSGV
jgi:aminoglycoside 6'-N-acetyltransferase I